MISTTINKQHRPIYRFAFILISLIAFLIIPMYIFADDGTDVKYVRIKNSWKPTEYLFEQNGKVVYGSPAANDPTSHWVVEDFKGAKRIKNRATGNYINISGHRKKGEADYWNDPVKCSEWKDDSNSFLWTTPVQAEGKNITSVLNSAFNIHVEDQNGAAQCSDVPSNWGSPQWLFENAPAAVLEVSANTNADANANRNTGTKVIKNEDVPPLSNPAPNAGSKVGGDVAFVFATPASGDSLVDQTFIPWMDISTYFNKNLGEHSSAYLKLRLSVYAAKPGSFTCDVKIPSLGYTYSINDGLSVSALIDGDGDVLADTQVLNDGYNWYYTFNDGTSMNMHNSPFANRAEIKMNTTVLPGLNLTFAYAFTNGTGLSAIPAQFLAKFKYTGPGFNISGGYTNTRNGYGDYFSDRPTYALSGALTAIPNLNLYGEYMEKGYYLVKANAQLNPFALKVTYGDLGYSRIGNPVYLANTLDCQLDYAFSPKLKLTGGVAYFLGTDQDGLATAAAGFTMGPLTLQAQHDFNADASSLSANTSNPDMANLATLIPNTTRFIGKYNLEGSSTLEAEFNLEKKIYSVMLHVGF